MKKYINILAAIILILITSCEDFIDNPPEDQIAVEAFFTTSNDVENYVKKYYAKLPSHGSANQPYSESNSDNLILATPNQVLNGTRAPQTGRWASNGGGHNWDEIRSLNILFDNIHKVKDELSSYKQYLGEAYFFRAWFYFGMLKTYGDLPIYTSQLLPGDEALMNPRNPRTEVADFILSDIDKAIEHLNKRSSTGNARISQEAALAFKTRVALYEGTWQKYHAGTVFGTSGADASKYFQKAVDAAEELINGSYKKGIYSTGNTATDYYDLFGMDDMTKVDEVLFQRIANSQENLGHDLQFYTTRRTRNMSITWSLVSSYLAKTGTPYDYLGLSSTTKGNAFLTQIATDCDPRLHATVWTPGDLRVASSGLTFDKPFLNGGSEELCATGFQVKKFSNPNSTAAGADWGKNSQTGYILFRYAEVLLNYAEAKYELDGTVATTQLNMLRSRVGMPDFTVVPQADFGTNLVNYGYTVSDELYNIRNERRVELALEGHRVSDYRRWAAHNLFKGKRPLGYPFDASEFTGYNPPLNADGLIDYFTSALPDGHGFRENQDYLSSIPQDEVSLNPNLSQNPGWE